MKKNLTIFIVLLVVVGAGSFFGGIKYGQSKLSFAFKNGNFPGGPGGLQASSTFAGQNRGGSFVSGEIISKDSSSITLKTANGGSKIVFYSVSTQIQKIATGTADDLGVGSSIVVTGTSNSDGSVTAKSIETGSLTAGGVMRTTPQQ
jgi:hypothetical protein